MFLFFIVLISAFWKSIYYLSWWKIFQVIPLAVVVSLYLHTSSTYRKCIIPTLCLSITCWINYSHMITFQEYNYHCLTPATQQFLSNCCRHIFRLQTKYFRFNYIQVVWNIKYSKGYQK